MSNTVLIRILTFAMSIYFIVLLAAIFAKAYDDSFYKKPDVYDLWTVNRQQSDSFALYSYLQEDGLIATGVSFGEFDYICVLTQQLCSMTKNVHPDLALAMIAVESNFDTNAKTGSARGLMQIIPIYHTKRMENYVEAGHQVDLDDFFDPRLNIMTGLDYMDYLLDETDGDTIYALMWYNQGATSASKDYLDNLRVSAYAKKVMGLIKDIETFLREEVAECS